MKSFAKWVALLWSLFCLINLIAGMISAGQHLSNYSSEAEKMGAGIGLSIGMGMWVGVWLAIAGPALVIYLVSSKKESSDSLPGPTVFSPPKFNSQGVVSLESETKKCPECAETVKLEAKKCRFCGQAFGPDKVAQEIAARRMVLQEEYGRLQKGERRCPQCGNWDVINAMRHDGAIGPFCPNCKRDV